MTQDSSKKFQTNDTQDSGENKKENFNFELPRPPVEPEIKYPAALPNYRQIPEQRTGLLSGVGTINVGYGVGVPVPGSPDGVSVGGRVSFGWKVQKHFFYILGRCWFWG